ncbi:MAG: sigma-70 family RNA polymerase sigma factor [Thermoanaerobaculia bacterium]|nr:sigma-70 family RNA polymerase sigma factor [Thermoanaerobaculia bacterium]
MQETANRGAEGPLPTPTDEALALLACGGSTEAFAELVRRFERPVFGLVVRLVRDPALAEDLAQEVFLRAWRALPTFDPERRFASWLLRIAHNGAIDALRRRRAAFLLPLEPPGDEEGREREIADPSAVDPEARAVGRDLARALERALARLRPEYRSALLLRFQRQLAYEEIAEVLGLPLGTVKTFLHRGRAELARALAVEGYRLPGAGSETGGRKGA